MSESVVPVEAAMLYSPSKKEVAIHVVFSETVVTQRVIYASLGLAQNESHTTAVLTRWTVWMASQFNMKKETIHSGLYLLFTYLAKIHTDVGYGRFIKYANKDILMFKNDDQFVVRYGISSYFKNNMCRKDNFLLIAASCLCMASKMEENHFDNMLKPHHIINATPVVVPRNIMGQHTVFDFITVERDILETLQWRLFRIQTPIFFTEILFYEFAIVNADKLLTEALLLVCLSSQEYVFTMPSDLAALCLIAAMHKNYQLAPIAAIAYFTGMATEFLVHESAKIVLLHREIPDHTPENCVMMEQAFLATRSSELLRTWPQPH